MRRTIAPDVFAYAGPVLLDNRHGLVANVCTTAATGTAERDAARLLLDASAPPGSTVGGDKKIGCCLARWLRVFAASPRMPHAERRHLTNRRRS